MGELESLDIGAEGLPEKVADAWVTVLLDLWEKDQAAAKQGQAAALAEEGGSSCPGT